MDRACSIEKQNANFVQHIALAYIWEAERYFIHQSSRERIFKEEKYFLTSAINKLGRLQQQTKR
jgi:hypothetical protein